MILDIFSELQRARPWGPDHEGQVYRDAIESVIIGDVDAVHEKLQAYADLGCDRLMCLMQMGAISHADVMKSIRLTGEELIPRLAG